MYILLLARALLADRVFICVVHLDASCSLNNCLDVVRHDVSLERLLEADVINQ
jgi:hypothetical protein